MTHESVTAWFFYFSSWSRENPQSQSTTAHFLTNLFTFESWVLNSIWISESFLSWLRISSSSAESLWSVSRNIEIYSISAHTVIQLLAILHNWVFISLRNKALAFATDKLVCLVKTFLFLQCMLLTESFNWINSHDTRD